MGNLLVTYNYKENTWKKISNRKKKTVLHVCKKKNVVLKKNLVLVTEYY